MRVVARGAFDFVAFAGVVQADLAGVGAGIAVGVEVGQPRFLARRVLPVGAGAGGGGKAHPHRVVVAQVSADHEGGEVGGPGSPAGG